MASLLRKKDVPLYHEEDGNSGAESGGKAIKPHSPPKKDQNSGAIFIFAISCRPIMFWGKRPILYPYNYFLPSFSCGYSGGGDASPAVHLGNEMLQIFCGFICIMNKESTFGVSKSTKYFHRLKHYVYLWKKHDSTFLEYLRYIQTMQHFLFRFFAAKLRERSLLFSPRPIIHRKSRTKRICLLSFSRERTKRATTFCLKHTRVSPAAKPILLILANESILFPKPEKRRNCCLHYWQLSNTFFAPLETKF